MELTLRRVWLGARQTVGQLQVGDRAVECFTLEDVVRDLGPAGEGKVPGQTAIPAGRYEVIVNTSRRFRRELPLLVGVPGFEGIRIHAGNTDEDTEGCVLVGLRVIGSVPGPRFTLEGSRLALEPLVAELRELLAKERCFMTVSQPAGSAGSA
jgi:hypothetical protein